MENCYRLVTDTALIQKLLKLRKIPDNAESITTNKFNKISGAIFQRLKKEELATTTDPNTIKHFATKNKEKIKKIQTFDSSFFKGNLMMVFKIRLFTNRHLVNWV